jgi:hypothetical protein
MLACINHESWDRAGLVVLVVMNIFLLSLIMSISQIALVQTQVSDLQINAKYELNFHYARYLT